MHKISARLRWYSFKFKTEECSFSSQLNNRLSSCASFNTFIGQYCTITTMYNKKRIEIDIKRDLRASNKFFEGIPVLARFATGPLEEVPPQKERSFPVFFLSLLDPYSSFSSLHSYHYFHVGFGTLVWGSTSSSIVRRVYTQQRAWFSASAPVKKDHSLERLWSSKGFAYVLFRLRRLLIFYWIFQKHQEHMFSNCSRSRDGQMIDWCFRLTSDMMNSNDFPLPSIISFNCISLFIFTFSFVNIYLNYAHWMIYSMTY